MPGKLPLFLSPAEKLLLFAMHGSGTLQFTPRSRRQMFVLLDPPNPTKTYQSKLPGRLLAHGLIYWPLMPPFRGKVSWGNAELTDAGRRMVEALIEGGETAEAAAIMRM